MRLADRLWWMRTLGSVPLLAVMAALCVFVWQAFSKGAALRPNAWLAAVTAVLVLALIPWCLATAAIARARACARARAIAGEPDALPVADISLDPTESRESITVRGVAYAPLRRLPVFVALNLLSVACAVAATVFALSAFADSEDQLALPGGLSIPALPMLIAASLLMFAAAVVLGRSARILFLPQSYVVSANESGMTFETTLTNPETFSWSSPRLFEVESYRPYAFAPRLPRQETYSVFTERGRIVTQAAPQSRRLSPLLATIAARTGLIPRTLDPALAVPGARLPESVVDRTSPCLVIAAGELAVGWLILVTAPAPLTQFQSAAIGLLCLSAACFLALFFALTALVPLRRRLRPDLPRVPAITSPLATPVVCPAGSSRSARALMVLAGLPLLFGTALSLLEVASQILARAHAASPLAIGAVVLDASLGLVVVDISVAGASDGAIGWLIGPRRAQLLADGAGLMWVRGPTRVALRWDEIDTIWALLWRGQLIGYQVQGCGGTVNFRWPVRRARRPRRAADPLSISGTEMATLVAARSGRSIAPRRFVADRTSRWLILIHLLDPLTLLEESETPG
jgi:hypothetical protein